MRQSMGFVRNYPAQIWIGFFIYTAIAALAVQFIILPFLLPELHWGQGLLAGLDSVVFHLETVDLAEKIKANGWGEWRLRPGGQGIEGVAVIFYYFIAPEPWTLIPLNAAIHATTILVLYAILTNLFDNKQACLYSAIIVGLFPSAMTWYTQMHKDGFSCMGMVMIVWAWVEISRVAAGRSKVQWLLASVSLSAIGSLSIWIVRPYLLEMIIVISVGQMMFLAGIAASSYRRGKISGTIFAIAMFAAGLCLVPPVKLPKLQEVILAKGGVARDNTWDYSDFLPARVDGWFKQVADVRTNFIQSSHGAGSNIDVDVKLSSAWDVVAYIPRSMQIAFLAPFPWDWFANGTSKANTYMRRVSGFEMMGVYLSMIVLLANAAIMARKHEFWIILMFVMGYMVVLGLSIPNVGTLYRMRYAPMAMLLTLGFAISFSRLARKSQRATEGPPPLADIC
ncbi:MAG: hypothetical protein OEV92_00515 [Nitrospinota bacterium]|nr:hypothetical protein [Nitrospinota bacterium]